MHSFKRKIAKGYSGRLLETKEQSHSRLKQETEPLSQEVNEVEPKKTNSEKKPSFFSLFPERQTAPKRHTSKPRHWTPKEDQLLREAVQLYGEKKWKQIAEHVPNRNHTQCLQRWSKVLAPGLKKGQWGKEEDDLLIQLVGREIKVAKVKEGKPKINWGKVSRSIKGRTAKQCRERWVNNLDPNITKASWTEDEDTLLLMLQDRYPKRWAMISKYLPGRTENAVKIRFKSLTRNIKTEEEKDELRKQVSKCTLDEQITKVKDQSVIRSLKEKESLKGRLNRFRSDYFPSFRSRNSRYSLNMNAVNDVPCTSPLEEERLNEHLLYSLPTPQIPESFHGAPYNSNYPELKKIDSNFSYSSDFLKSSINLNDLFLGQNQQAGPTSFHRSPEDNSRPKRRASTTTSTLNNSNSGFHDIFDHHGFSHLNLFTSVPSQANLDHSYSERSFFKDILLPVHEVPRVSSNRNMLLQHQHSSDRSIDMAECLRLLSTNPHNMSNP